MKSIVKSVSKVKPGSSMWSREPCRSCFDDSVLYSPGDSRTLHEIQDAIDPVQLRQKQRSIF